MGRRQLLRALGYAISAACLVALAFHVNWTLFLAYLKSAHPTPIAGAILMVAMTYVVFAQRWRILLAIEPAPSMIQVSTVLMLGHLGNLLLPMRAGDALRVVMVQKRFGHSAARAMSSVVLERLFDVLAVLCYGALVTLIAPLSPTLLIALRTAMLLAIAGFAMVAFFVVHANSSAAIIERVVGSLHPRLGETLGAQVRHFGDAIRIVFPTDRGSSMRVISVFALSVLAWGMFAVAMILCVAAFDVTPAIAAGLSIMVVTNLGSAIPSSPASIGVYEALAVLSLSPWGVGADLALSVATISHAVAIAVQLLLGLLAAVLGRNVNPSSQGEPLERASDSG